MLIAREALPNLSLPQIARRFCRDHTTVMHGIKTARSRLEWDGDYLDGYLAACEALGIHTAPQAIESHTKACLRCGEDFLSEGPHHRMCDNRSCREARDKQSSAIDWEPFGAQWS